MPVPKRKTSKARRNKRSANKGMRVQAITACLTCQEPLNPHQVCKLCGHYKGLKIIQTKMDRLQLRSKTLQKSRSSTQAPSSSDVSE